MEVVCRGEVQWNSPTDDLFLDPLLVPSALSPAPRSVLTPAAQGRSHYLVPGPHGPRREGDGGSSVPHPRLLPASPGPPLPRGAVAAPQPGLSLAHLAVLGGHQDLVLLLGVENQLLCREGDDLLPEGVTLIRAEEQVLLPVAERRAHEDDL